MRGIRKSQKKGDNWVGLGLKLGLFWVSGGVFGLEMALFGFVLGLFLSLVIGY